jgi:putative transport protein
VNLAAFSLLDGQSVAGTVMIIALVGATGLALGSIRVKGVGLGIAGVLFTGLFFGHLGVAIDEHVLEFLREFGLILFVYSIGMQVGPGFLASLRRAGLPLNLMAASVVLLGVATAVAIHLLGGVEVPAMVGLLSGATTNTPSLAAAQQAIKEAVTDDALRAAASTTPGLGYAMAYPFGVIGIILVMVFIRMSLRIVPSREEEMLRQSLGTVPRLNRVNLEVTNPNLAGVAVKDLPLPSGSGIVISRLFQHGELSVPQPESKLAVGDVLLAVGTPRELEQLRIIVGRQSEMDLRTLPSTITTRRIVVTHGGALGRTLADLDFVRRFGVAISRVSRADVDFTPTAGFELQFGDSVLAVGEDASLRRVAGELGDSPKSLNHTQLVPMFLGMAIGVFVGTYPLQVPGVPAPLKLGLAGGPLLVAIILSRVGRVGPLLWYMPISANFMLRELGIVMFLGCVGLRSGHRFVETLTSGPGLQWMFFGALITLLPLLIVGFVARLVFKVNFLMLCGLLAGSMTDPPALAFANAAAGSDYPSVAYATVYPLAMILRVVSAQLLVILLMH